MGKTYRAYQPDQLFLLPPSLVEWLPKNHLVFFIREVLDEMDLTPITNEYEDEERGYPPYHPKVMTGILLYGYCCGITSSRKLAKHCQEDVAFRVLAANNQPDHRTIGDFRKRALEEEAQRGKDNDHGKPPSAPSIPMAKVKTTPDAKGTERVADSAQGNFTDPESRILPYPKTFVQGYNAQIAVDSAHQIIVATDLSNHPKDEDLLRHMVKRLPEKPEVMTADAAYGTPENITYLTKRHIDAYIAIKREKHGPKTEGPPRGRIPEHFSVKERMARKAIVEPVFGQIKNAQGIRAICLRTYAKARAEWFLIAATHNLRKLFSASIRESTQKLLWAT